LALFSGKKCAKRLRLAIKFLDSRFSTNFSQMRKQITAVTENGKRNAENGICANLLFREFDDSTNSQGKGFFSRHSQPHNDYVALTFCILRKFG